MHNPDLITAEFGDISAYQDCPDFWLVKPEQSRDHLASLNNATIKEIGRSAGDREILVIEYGEKEDIGATTDNLQSAIAAKVVPADPTDIFPEAFYGTRRRKQPSVVLQGGIHGGELTGTAAMLNLCELLERGRDLRGREWPRLTELAAQTRLCMIPWLNPDGTARWPIPNTSGVSPKLYNFCQHGISLDGSPYVYPAVKSIAPIPPEKTAYMGSYYNDNGVNLQYDFHMPHRQPETVAWMDYYLEERPDGVMVDHCNAGTLISNPEYYLPPGFQHEQSRLGGAVRRRLQREGLYVGRLSWAGIPGMGKPGLNQVGAIYLACGAMPILVEYPMGGGSKTLSCDEMLDIGLYTLEEMLEYAHSDGLRPYELWEKVRSGR